MQTVRVPAGGDAVSMAVLRKGLDQQQQAAQKLIQAMPDSQSQPAPAQRGQVAQPGGRLDVRM